MAQPHMLLCSGDYGPCPTTPLSQDQAQLLIFACSRCQSLRSKQRCARWLRGRPAGSPDSTRLPPTGASLHCWQHVVMTHAGELPATSSVLCRESYLAALTWEGPALHETIIRNTHHLTQSTPSAISQSKRSQFSTHHPMSQG